MRHGAQRSGVQALAQALSQALARGQAGRDKTRFHFRPARPRRIKSRVCARSTHRVRHPPPNFPILLSLPNPPNFTIRPRLRHPDRSTARLPWPQTLHTLNPSRTKTKKAWANR